MRSSSDPSSQQDPRTEQDPGTAPEPAARHAPRAGRSESGGHQTAPAEDENETPKQTGHHHINPARMEVRVRRIALLGLVLVPVVYFLVQSLR